MTITPIEPATVFHVRGELSQQAISALARLLIDHARRELEEEQRDEDQGSDDHHPMKKPSTATTPATAKNLKAHGNDSTNADQDQS